MDIGGCWWLLVVVGGCTWLLVVVVGKRVLKLNSKIFLNYNCQLFKNFKYIMS